jgi:nucleoid DNA-binding protein
MLDKLIEFGKEQLSSQLQQKAGLQTTQVDKTLDVSKDSLTSTLISQVAGGNIGQLMSLFNGGSPANTSNPVVSSMVSNLATDLAAKVGISPQIAQNAANIVVPFIMQKFASNESGTAKNEGDLLDKLGISGNDAIASVAKSFLGDKGGDLLGGFSKMFS